MISQSDIALKAGCSQRTVSRALRNDPGISRATREKIQGLAAELGYKKDPLVTALMIQRNNRKKLVTGPLTIAYVTTASENLIEWQRSGELNTLYQTYQSICSQAEVFGYKIEHFSLANYAYDSSRLNKVLISRGIQSIVLGPTSYYHYPINLSWENYCVVAIGNHFSGVQFDRVLSDYYYNTKLAIQQLSKKGSRRIGLCLGHLNGKLTEGLWHAAYIHYQLTTKIDSPLELYEYEEWNANKFKDWISVDQPDALLYYPDDVFSYLEKTQNPSEHRIHNMCSLLWNAKIGGDVGIDPLPEEIGKTAVEFVINKRNNNLYGLSDPAKHILIRGKWVEGQTV